MATPATTSSCRPKLRRLPHGFDAVRSHRNASYPCDPVATKRPSELNAMPRTGHCWGHLNRGAADGSLPDTSQTFTIPGCCHVPLTSHRLSALKPKLDGPGDAPLSNRQTLFGRSATLHRFTVVPIIAASHRPLALTATASAAAASCIRCTGDHEPSADQTSSMLSVAPALAIHRPSGLTAALLRLPVCPRSTIGSTTGSGMVQRRG